ncbi:M23 family metallopeptidase [Paenibacillus sp. MMS20-IR301]|uniref:M23 family metallopeptidase n=1 Tax=Paenibacillus sp. MMS20-IR301 TaxID=2895946 RepID=UPI0028ECE793|nr:M23 family metallopeptidase [Paenibacillus sp. MMS20-IR301]WNS43593.1 M23 family metallopeptidase [Paenibacillus sp. MMS20-IR301]
MEYPRDIKNRRKKRIQSLLEEPAEAGAAAPALFTLPEKAPSFREWGTNAEKDFTSTPEPDPELVWKQQRSSWEDEGGGGPRFGASFIRRTVASLLVFGAVWGIFAAREPWALKSQFFITDALSNDMDFAAVQVWYEEHFNGAPSFIPIFGGREEPAEKVTAAHELTPPLAGSIARPFAASLNGIEIIPSADSSDSVTVKSVDTGRVLSVSKEAQGGIRITVRHTGDITAEYGHLSGTRLAVDDWVQSGDPVGWLQGTEDAQVPLLFFAIMKDKSYIDPAEVVSFD